VFEWGKANGRNESSGCGKISDLDYAHEILSGSINSYKYSARSINLGSKLQKKQAEHQMGLVDGYSKLFSHESINFNFSELSLFKASVSCSVQKAGSKFPQKQVSGELRNVRETVILTLKEMFSEFNMRLDGPPDFISWIENLSHQLDVIYCQIFKKKSNNWC
jgi:hypothetical protein